MKKIFVCVLGLFFVSTSITQAVTFNMACNGSYGDANMGAVSTTGFSVGAQISYIGTTTLGSATTLTINLSGGQAACSRIGSNDHPCSEDTLGSVHVLSPTTVYFGAKINQVWTPPRPSLTLGYFTNFVATNEPFNLPSQVGQYLIQAECTVPSSDPLDSYTDYFPYNIVAPASTACDDGNDNDGDGLVDANDPRCHTNCTISNPSNPAESGSYIRNPAFNSENNPACPAPASLQLNGRAAFFQVVKNFFASITARAFAGE